MRTQCNLWQESSAGSKKDLFSIPSEMGIIDIVYNRIKKCFKDKHANEHREKPGDGAKESDCSDKAFIFTLSLKETQTSYFKHV